MKINEYNDNAKSWNAALGIQKIDGFIPNEEFKTLIKIKREIKGEMTTDEMIKKLIKKHKQ